MRSRRVPPQDNPSGFSSFTHPPFYHFASTTLRFITAVDRTLPARTMLHFASLHYGGRSRVQRSRLLRLFACKRAHSHSASLRYISAVVRYPRIAMPPRRYQSLAGNGAFAMRTSLRSRRRFSFQEKRHRSPSPLRLLSANHFVTAVNRALPQAPFRFASLRR